MKRGVAVFLCLVVTHILIASIFPFCLSDVASPRGYLHFTKEPPDELRFSNSTGARIECGASGHPEPVSAEITVVEQNKISHKTEKIISICNKIL